VEITLGHEKVIFVVGKYVRDGEWAPADLNPFH